jgi:hypothetical protein
MRRIIFGLFLLPSLYLSGQALDTSGSALLRIPDSISNIYLTSQNESLPIYSGRLYYPVMRIEDHPFAYSEEWQKGTIWYDGVSYPDITYKYDTYMQELVVVTPRSIPVRVISERVQRFDFGPQSFIRHNPDKDQVLKTGFYQQLETGNVSILVHRQKIIQERIVQTTLERKFISLDTYYALKDGRYYPINNHKNLLGLMGDSRQAVTRHLKQKRLKYKHGPENYILNATRFYNQSHK